MFTKNVYKVRCVSVRIVPAANYVLTLPEEQRRFSDDAIS